MALIRGRRDRLSMISPGPEPDSPVWPDPKPVATVMNEPHQIKVEREVEGPNHWTYEVVVEQNGARHDYRVTLSWADYDLWSHGRIAPERVVQTAMAFLLERESASMILSRFDCSVIRRYFPEVDRKLPKML